MPPDDRMCRRRQPGDQRVHPEVVRGKACSEEGAHCLGQPQDQETTGGPGPAEPRKDDHGMEFPGWRHWPADAGITLAVCKKRCKSNRSCVGIVYDQRQRTCRLKKVFQRQVQAKQHFAWARQSLWKPAPPAPEPGEKVNGWAWQGGNLGKPVRDAKMFLCKNRCVIREECAGFVYRKHGLSCQLKT